ncbi:hypothetical protein J4410_06460 [Candidatus Woesearchaeota archaeon]|nr:hypothetical protein [Candidatus Woesearchaeota archaeon]
MKNYLLPYTVVSITQQDCKLLTTISCNTLDKPRNALLDRFGKIVLIFWQKQISKDEMLLVFPEVLYPRFLEHCEKYLKLSRAQWKRIDYFTYLVFHTENSFDKLGKEEIEIREEHFSIFLTKQKKEEIRDEKIFAYLRLHYNLPLQTIDYEKEMILNVFPQIASLTKGCYPGQEIVSRTMNYAKPPKKLTVLFEDELQEKERKNMTSVLEENGRKKGFCFVKNI